MKKSKIQKEICWRSQRRKYYQGEGDSMELNIRRILTQMGGMKSEFKIEWMRKLWGTHMTYQMVPYGQDMGWVPERR